MSVIEIKDLTKTYPASPPVRALTGLELTVNEAERVAVVGKSGSGKSTLLNILGLLDIPTSGSYRLLGEETEKASARRRDRLRAEYLGFVFQDFHVLGHRTTYENIELKLAILNIAPRLRPSMIHETLERVGLVDRMHSLARLLSGGEKQRLAIARAIVTRSQILLADEPTGNLDEENTNIVLELFDEQAEQGVSVVVITHDPRIASWADRKLSLQDGCLLPAGATA